MAIKKCSTSGCGKNTPRRNIFCPACWAKLPKNVQMDVRTGTAEGQNTLRAHPEKEWMSKAYRYISGERVEDAQESVTMSVMKTYKAKKKWTGKQHAGVQK